MRKIKWIFILPLFLLGEFGWSQTTTISPYSKYGIGVLRTQSFLQSFSLGGTSIGLRSKRDINLSNPASYSELSITTFEVGVINNSIFLDDGNQTQNQNNPYISHIAFAFPIINKKWGMSFGLLPYSNIGYNYSSTLTDPVVGDITILSNGEGGLNRAYLGNAWSFKLKRGIDPIGGVLSLLEGREEIQLDSLGTVVKVKNYHHDSLGVISFGVNGNYIFGNTEIDKKVVYTDLSNGLNSDAKEQRSTSDFNADFGIQYQKKFTHTNKKTNREDNYQLVLGASVTLASDLNGRRTELIRSFTGSRISGTFKDTISLLNDVKNVTELPLEYGAGFSITKENKWLFAADFRTADWSSITSNDPIFTYSSNYSIATGFELTPKYNGRNYFQRVNYRIGARYSTSYISINNQDILEYGITFGARLPVRRTGTSFPGVSIGFEYGSRGKAENGLIKETFYNFNVGLTINDKWFQKRKID